jgi:putative DNA primase/helicase
MLSELVGIRNVAGPTLSSLGGEFGLAPLQGKSLAVISDARLNGRDTSVVVERLLSISGEDRLTINRKYREQTTGTLPARLMLCSNELPRLGDASAAIAGRFVPLLLAYSWLGNEDHDLEPGLRQELAGIFNWALVGLERLTNQGRFTRAPGAEEAIITLQDLASPVAAFIRDRCAIGPGRSVTIDQLYGAYQGWAEANGYKPLSKQVFGRDLRASQPAIKVTQPGSGDNRPRWYEGIGLRP